MVFPRRRVAITGIGVISPLGNTKESMWEYLSGGKSGVAPLSGAATEPLPVSFGAEARNFQGKIDEFGPLEKEQKKTVRKNLKVMCRESQMGVAAAQLALADAGISPGSIDPERSGVCFGSDLMFSPAEDFTHGIARCLNQNGQFEFSRWALDGMDQMEPLWLLKYLPNMPASHVAIFNQLCGPNNSITLREASSNAAVAEGFDVVADGRADVMLCGATGTRLDTMHMLRVVQQEEVARGNGDPGRISRPFDRDRTGMVLGEGAGAVILEELSRAEARGAGIYGELIGKASSSVSDRRSGPQRERAMSNALDAVLKHAGLPPEEVGHLNAHGLSTPVGDAEEARAIQAIFAGRKEPLPVVAPKSFFGNLGAGSGMVELAASLMALNRGRLFPVLNFEHPDPGCPVAAVTGYDVPCGSSFVSLNVTPLGQAVAIASRLLEV